MSLLKKFLKSDKKKEGKDVKKAVPAKEHTPKNEIVAHTPVDAVKDNPRQDAMLSHILVRPHITEKSTGMKILNKYVVEVETRVNKLEIKKAIKKLFGVAPLRINSLRVSGKIKRYGKNSGKTKDRKKVVITLKEGDKIDVGEGS